MKIIFESEGLNHTDTPFAVYNYDEVLAKHTNYIDIRRIIKDRGDAWLDEIQGSFSGLSTKFLRYTRWWWITPMSRLDARSWGQEYVLKPLFFANQQLHH